MISQRPTSFSPETRTGIAVDHIGVVVRDLEREIAAWRALGFHVSNPVPLMGRDEKGRAVPLGQSSAHIVFANTYVELSSPVPGSGNHLERYLVLGDGVRILVLAADDAGSARAALAPHGPDMAAPRDATRAIEIAGRADVARFVWFPLPIDVIPGVLSAVVQHLTPELVFHPSLVAHAN
ncbi:MAG: VOC family protein, partial [Alphaproteobacteria bacterium]|nr:VOC family protein [Alphaproteobacteria bacterium]